MVRDANKEREQFKTTFGFKALREDFNRPAAIHLKNNIHNYINGDVKADEKADYALELITKLINSSMVSVLCNTALQPVSARKLTRTPETQGASHIMVPYTKAKNAEGDGRWFSGMIGSMQGMNRRVRHTICSGIWIDIDMVNCHPVLLNQMCKRLRCDIIPTTN